MTDQKYTHRNQAQEILGYIKSHPHCSTENIVSGTGWNRHLVEVAVKLMVEQGLIRETGKTEWGDYTFEAIDRDGSISSPLVKAASIMSGFTAGFVNPFSGMIADAVEQKRLLAETAALANVTQSELVVFCQTHPCGLEFIKAAIQAGAKLDEEDIKRTMEERAKYSFGWSPLPTPVEIAFTKLEKRHTFIVTLPNNDSREVKAAYMEVDGATLYFEDEDHDTILAFGPGHWVWAERKEKDT